MQPEGVVYVPQCFPFPFDAKWFWYVMFDRWHRLSDLPIEVSWTMPQAQYCSIVTLHSKCMQTNRYPLKLLLYCKGAIDSATGVNKVQDLCQIYESCWNSILEACGNLIVLMILLHSGVTNSLKKLKRQKFFFICSSLLSTPNYLLEPISLQQCPWVP